MKSLETLGLKAGLQIPICTLLSENFNGHLYGLSEKEIATVRALHDVVMQYNAQNTDSTVTVTNSAEAAKIVYGMLSDLEHEQVWCAFMNNACRLISAEMLFKGSLSMAPMGNRDIIAKALSLGASRLILYHNHPSGDPKPSRSDIEMTDKLHKACELMDIELMDHLIIAKGKYYSFCDEKTTPFKKQ